MLDISNGSALLNCLRHHLEKPTRPTGVTALQRPGTTTLACVAINGRPASRNCLRIVAARAAWMLPGVRTSPKYTMTSYTP